MQIKQLKLEKEMYQEARNKGATFGQFLETLDPSEEYGDGPLSK